MIECLDWRGGAPGEGTDVARHSGGVDEDCPDPMIQQPTDAIVPISSLAAYGSHLHLHDVPDLYLRPDNIFGHQPMGIVEQMVAQISHVQPSDRVVIASHVSCGH